MRIERFVLDCNIRISYLITRKTDKLGRIIEDNELTVFACDELFEELERFLGYPHLEKFRVDISGAIKLVKKFTVYDALDYPIKRYLPNDKNDDYLIALALQTNSGFIT